MKKRILMLPVLTTGALVAAIVSAHGALAGGPTGYPSTPTVTPTVLPTVVHNGGGNPSTAFTGANLAFGIVALVALVVIGAAALLVARRRAARLDAGA